MVHAMRQSAIAKSQQSIGANHVLACTLDNVDVLVAHRLEQLNVRLCGMNMFRSTMADRSEQPTTD
jgi:hypothetical protein